MWFARTKERLQCERWCSFFFIYSYASVLACFFQRAEYLEKKVRVLEAERDKLSEDVELYLEEW